MTRMALQEHSGILRSATEPLRPDAAALLRAGEMVACRTSRRVGDRGCYNPPVLRTQRR
jgi:hypothetical protein